jgi:hypothetical protein
MIFKQTHTFICKHTERHTSKQKFTYKHKLTHTYIQRYTYIHTNTHTHTTWMCITGWISIFLNLSMNLLCKRGGGRGVVLRRRWNDRIRAMLCWLLCLSFSCSRTRLTSLASSTSRIRPSAPWSETHPRHSISQPEYPCCYTFSICLTHSHTQRHTNLQTHKHHHSSPNHHWNLL